MWGTDECGVCGERLRTSDTDVAEMYDPADSSGKHVICHYECGTNDGLELA